MPRLKQLLLLPKTLKLQLALLVIAHLANSLRWIPPNLMLLHTKLKQKDTKSQLRLLEMRLRISTPLLMERQTLALSKALKPQLKLKLVKL